MNANQALARRHSEAAFYLGQQAEAHMGLAYVFEDQVRSELANGRLVKVLEPWCEPIAGFFLYYPSRRHTPPALAALVAALRVTEPRRSQAASSGMPA
jgi:DNA-binding transcriptional LysR family regulator